MNIEILSTELTMTTEIFNNTTNGSQATENKMQSNEENYICEISTMNLTDKNISEEENTNSTCIDCIEINRNEEEQTITELVRASSENNVFQFGQGGGGMRVAFGIILRLMLPLANGVARGIQGIRDVRFLNILKSIASSRHALTNLVAFAANTISMNLSSVQVSHRIAPILKLMKIRKSRDGLESLPDNSNSLTISDEIQSEPTTPTMPRLPNITSPFLLEPSRSLPHFSPRKRVNTIPGELAPKCCTLNILAEPPPGEAIRADIVFIHGLHGSLANTWKQGLWENDRRPVEFDRPPRPQVRPPKRPRHSRSTTFKPPHKQKRARFAQRPFNESKEFYDELEELLDAQHTQTNGEVSYICGEAKNIQMCDDLEYSFPTFRVRMNESSRLLQAELESILNNENSENQPANKKSHKGKNTPKPSPDDPDYSKCWPGDWLPLDCPGVRVIAINYSTDPYLWRPLWKNKEPRTNLIQRAREMAELLIAQRVGYGHPIVWVGHSKGGLFVKQIIVDAWESGRPAMAPFWRSSRGVFFYSVPHRGSHLASIKAPLLTRSVELLDIEKNNKYLLDLHRRFAGLYHLGHLKIEVFSFVETALTLMSVLYLRIVGVDSADPGIGDVCGIRLDHREICKPRSRDCILYKELVKMINKVC